jgi:hypothetical protein
MANKQISVIVDVDSSKVDATAKKLGQLKDFGKDLKIQYDIDGKPIDVVIDKSLNLQRQARILTAELRKTREGTAEFELLSTKLGDVQDGLTRTKAKSGDLFTSLQLLPGPVGEFASKTNGAIALLKTFSSFTLKDLKFQLMETIGDFKDIASNIGKATGITKVYGVMNEFLAATFVKVGVAEGAAAVGARAFAAALTATGIGAIVVGLGMLVSALMNVGDEADLTANKVARLNTEFAKLDKDASLLGEQRIAQMKAEGASEGELYATRKQLKEDEITRARNAFRQFQVQMDAAEVMQGKDTEGYKNALKSKQEAEVKLKQAKSDLIVMGFNEQERVRKETEQREKQARDKSIANAKATQDRILADTKTASKIAMSLYNELQIVNTKNKFLQRQKQLEQDTAIQYQEIMNLKLQERKVDGIVYTAAQQRNELIQRLNDLAQAKSKVIRDEYNDALNQEKIDIKDAEIELLKQTRDIKTQMIKDEYEKDKTLLQEKADDEIEAVGKSIATEEYKSKAIAAIKAKLKFDIEKLDEDTAQKARDKEIKGVDEALKFLQIKKEGMVAGTKSYFKTQEEIQNASYIKERLDLEDALAKKEISVEEAEKRKEAILKKYAKAAEDLEREKLNTNLGFISAGLSAFSSAIGQQQQINQLAQQNELDAAKGNAAEQDAIKKKYFEKNKKTQIAQAIIGTLQGAIQAYQSLAVIPVVGPALGAVAAAAALVFGYKQVSLIKAQEYQSSSDGSSSGSSAAPQANYGKNYADGGMINGPRHSQGGVPINAEGGEAVMTRGSVTMFRPLLSMMNQMGGGTSFMPNLTTTSFDAPKTENPAEDNKPMVIKSYVVSSELTNDQQRQARLKDLSTL